jgi:hypothetical protein
MSRNEVQIELSRAQHAQNAHAAFLSISVSVANKGSVDQIPKLEVAGSIPVARSIFLGKFLHRTSKSYRNV